MTWKVEADVAVERLQEKLNEMEKDGWTIFSIHHVMSSIVGTTTLQKVFPRFTVVARKS